MMSTTLLRDQRGFSLIELLVSMMLFGIILVLAAGLFVSTSHNVKLVNTTSLTTKSASNGMNEIARVIRAATSNPVAGQQLNDPAFVLATNEAVILYAYINLDSTAEQPVMIRLDLDANRNLRESRWPATALTGGKWSFPCKAEVTCAATPASIRTLTGTVQTRTSGDWLFTYLNSAGVPLTVPAGGFTAADLRTIASVRVRLTIQPGPTDASNPTTLTNTVGIPNLGFTRTGG